MIDSEIETQQNKIPGRLIYFYYIASLYSSMPKYVVHNAVRAIE